MRQFFASLLLTFSLAACTSTTVSEKREGVLRFQDGKFKIAQFTDIHVRPERDTTAVKNMIMTVVATERPQLLVLTGDNVTDAEDIEQNKAEWRWLVTTLESAKVPYAIVMGNHDAEACDSVNADILESWIGEMSELCMNYPTTSNCYGHGNKALEVLGEKSDSVKAVVYTIDSNDYPDDPELGYYSSYDWIHPDQIEWYEQQSENYTKRNDGKPVPSLAFFHICVPEYNEVAEAPNTFGSFNEPCSPPTMNTGFFASAMRHKDIMGMFVGHDHTNDFCGIHQNIALCYGRQSGVEERNDPTPLGSRIIELTEGKRSFETWVRTETEKCPVWHYPTGFNTTMDTDLLPAVEPGKVKNGVHYTYYEGPENTSVNAILVSKNKKSEGLMDNLDITKATADDHFGYAFDTYFLAETSGPYSFKMRSDDGAILLIDGKELINNDGSHSSSEKKNFIGLAKGLHHIEVKYFEDHGGQELKLSVESRSLTEGLIPDRLLFIPAK